MRKQVKELYASYGVDVFEALRKLKETKISLHCWQLDDVQGFENSGDLSGGIQTTGNYPGKARNYEELTQDLQENSVLIILYALLGEYCYAFYFLFVKYINTTYFINIYLLTSVSGILNICIELPSLINSSYVKFQSIYLFYILIMIIYYYCHFTIIKNLGPIHSTIVYTISYCIIKLFYKY